MDTPPRVLVPDGDNINSLSVAKELTDDLDATVIGAGTSRYSRLLRSRYCDRGVVLPARDDSYRESLHSLIESTRPDVVLPIGARSAVALYEIRSRVQRDVSLCLPPPTSFRAARDKATTLSIAERIGLDTPDSYTSLVADLEEDGRPIAELSELPFPVFLKARQETDGTTTELVRSPSRFWDAYDRIVDESPDGEVIVQEYVNGSTSTFGCGLLFDDGEVELVFGHEELRSVPRRGGSGTHLRIHRDTRLESEAIRLLREIGWQGVALVEFKRRADGAPVLMEVNPKFWASYALASSHGYRFASTMVANTLGMETPWTDVTPRQVGEMTFPLREFGFYLQNREREDLRECIASVFRPGAQTAIELRDLRAWLTPPVEVLRRVPWIELTDQPCSERSSEPTLPRCRQ